MKSHKIIFLLLNINYCVVLCSTYFFAKARTICLNKKSLPRLEMNISTDIFLKLPNISGSVQK